MPNKDFTAEVVAKVADRIAEREAYDRINALFDGRVIEGGNCAYCLLEVSTEGSLELTVECPLKGFPDRLHWSQVFAYAYRQLINGAWQREAGPRAPNPGLQLAVNRSVAAVEKAWPDRSKLQVIWRVKPEASDQGLYMRLVATPVV